MHNSILTAILLMLVPEMASAQFYTITKETEIKSIQVNDKKKSINNKKDADVTKSMEITKDTIVALSTDIASLKSYAQNVDGKTSPKIRWIKPNGHLPELTIPNLYAEIKRNGILYPKVVLAQAILETGWFRSPVCLDKHNLFGLTNPRTGKYYEFEHWTESVRAYYTKVQYKYKEGNYLLWLRDIGYAEDSGYIRSVISVLKQL